MILLIWYCDILYSRYWVFTQKLQNLCYKQEVYIYVYCNKLSPMLPGGVASRQ